MTPTTEACVRRAALPGQAPPPGPRLLEIDALRGLAAMAVVLFHYTARLQELHPAAGQTVFSVPWGQYGVNLFFMLSGFVIFMTLERCRNSMDFVVSRFARLYPTYWFCVALTYGVLVFAGLDGWSISPMQATGNLLMFHGLFFVPNVDAVYWTLEVELLFYSGMLALHWSGMLRKAWLVCLILLGLRSVYFLCATFWQLDLSWTISRLLILPHIPWFSLGIGIYIRLRHQQFSGQRNATVLIAAALCSIAIEDSVAIGALALALVMVLELAARGRLPLLKSQPFVWLGAISYPLYLLHENIGWSWILHAVGHGVPVDWAVGTAVCMSLALAHAVSTLIERPAMRWIRASYAGKGLPT